MTKQEAKELTIEVWTYLAERPELTVKDRLPDYLWDKISGCKADCPLCEIFCIGRYVCPGCPLDTAKTNCFLYESPYREWDRSRLWQKGLRARCARTIVRRVSAWDPGVQE
jgi:hypothetical protein